MSFEKRGQDALRGLAFFFGLLFVTEVALILVFGVDYRYVEAGYIGPSCRLGIVDFPLRMLVPCLASLAHVRRLQLFLTRTFIGRAIMAVAQDQLALQLMAADPIRIKRIAFGISIATASIAGALLIIIQPVEPSVGREYIGRVFAICVLGGLGSLPGTVIAAHAARRRREPHRHLLRPVLGAGGGLRLPAAHARRAAGRPAGTLTVRTCVDILTHRRSRSPPRSCSARTWSSNDYLFFAGYACCNTSCSPPPGISSAAIAAM